MAGKREYRISQIEGKITWQVEELWAGGKIRGPYGTKDAAVTAEKKVAVEAGYLDDLVLTATIGNEVKPENAFTKDEAGKWVCVQACSISIGNKEVVFTKGLTFSQEAPSFMGVNVAEWLEENVKT